LRYSPDTRPTPGTPRHTEILGGPLIAPDSELVSAIKGIRLFASGRFRD
jgi:hypothetical protein